MKAAVSVPLKPLELVTTTSAGAAGLAAGTATVIVVLFTTVTFSGVSLTVTLAPATNPVPLIMTGVGRIVEPVDGEIAVTLGAAAELGVPLGAMGGTTVGSDGDRPSQALDAIANANSNTLPSVLLVMAFASWLGSGNAP